MDRSSKKEKSEDASLNLTVESAPPETEPSKVVEVKPRKWEPMEESGSRHELQVYAPDLADTLYKEPLVQRPLHLEVEPTKFVIDVEKGTKFRIKCLSEKRQDLIITCDSYLFEIKNPRGKHGRKSQIFHNVQQNDTFFFDIGLREENDLPNEKNIELEPNCAEGYLEILHYRRFSNEDGDEFWRIERKNQMVRPQIFPRYGEDKVYGLWRDVLKPSKETEEIKKRRLELREMNWQKLQRASIESIEKELIGAVMMTKSVKDDPEEKTDREAEENLRTKDPKWFLARERSEQRRKSHMQHMEYAAQHPELYIKKKKKKCVIM
ncbi:hypothetical protein CAEBREN_08945 [Caenorhabditis brenneri]|uniref:Uncharacterized protein n=1 Tax=Caenorhabditis brenneri TaxID=135651 RepID=G0MIN0_CAEBE|nr:hypothetical protein CAEBREN_08945 [Caenorhabditis brenneri]